MSERKKKVLVCDKVELEKLALTDDFQVDYRPTITREELLEAAAGYEIIVIRSRTRIDAAVLDRATSLKLVARPGTGLDNVDVEHARSRGVAVVNSPESLVEAVAEHAILLMLALTRKLTAADASTKAGKWEKTEFMGTETKGKTLGIVGLGKIGQRVGELAGALGMSILIYDVVTIPPDVLAKLGAKVVGLDDLFAAADYVSLHVPLTQDTRHLVDARRLSLMKRSAFIVNTSRGGVIDEDALARALKNGALGGAGLDVFETEPPSGEVLSAPNAVLTPHIGGQTLEAQVNAITVVGEKIKAFFHGS
jgi:D-3-phosphoglycerate dehydrogenase